MSIWYGSDDKNGTPTARFSMRCLLPVVPSSNASDPPSISMLLSEKPGGGPSGAASALAIKS